MPKKTEKHNLRNLLLGAGAAAGTYALLRKPRFSSIPEIAEAQRKSRGKITSVLSNEPHMKDYDVEALLSKNPLRRAYNWVTQGGIKHVRAEDIKPGTHFEGAVYDDVNMLNSKWNSKNITGDVIYNSNKTEFKNKLQDKQNFANMPEFKGNVLPTTSLSKLLKGKNPKTPQQMYDALKQHNVFIKLRSGMGFHEGFQGKPERILKKDEDVAHLIKHKDKYIAQPLFANDKEYGVHAIIQNGKINLSEAHVKVDRGEETIGHSFNPNKHEALAAYVQEALGPYAKKKKHENMILGLDVFHDTKANKFKINEINDNSGSFRMAHGRYGRPYFITSPHRQYKALTGRNSQPVAVLGGVAAGTLVTGISKTHDKVKTAKEKEKSLTPMLLGAAATTALGAAAFKKFRVPHFSADPYLRAIQEKSKGRLTIADSASDNPLWRAVKRVFNPSVQHISASANAGKKYEGAVLNISNSKGITGDVTINSTSDRDKYLRFANKDVKNGRVSEMKQWTIPQKSFDNILREHAGISHAEFKKLPKEKASKVLKDIGTKKDYYIKPSNSYASRGVYSPIGEVENMNIRNSDRPPRRIDANYPKDPIKTLQNEGHNYIVQENLHPVHELRFHTLGHKIIGDSQNRVSHVRQGRIVGMQTKLPETFDRDAFENTLKKTLKNRGIKDPAFMGWDMIVTPKGKTKILEANTDSGFAFSPGLYSRYGKLHKEITGKETVERSVVKALGVGAVAGLPTYAVAKKMEKTGEKKEHHTLRNTAILGATGLTAGVMAKYLMDKGVAPKFYNAFRNNMDRYVEDIPQKPLSQKVMKKIEELRKEAKEKKHTLIKDTTVAGGLGLAGGATYALANHNTETHKNIKRWWLSQNSAAGRLPVQPKAVEQAFLHIGGNKIPKAGHKGSLGAYLRSQPMRPKFGDDSELIIMGVDENRVPYVHNIEGNYKHKTWKGENYSITQDSTVGGLELNVKPGNADDLFRRFHRGITEGAPNVVDPHQHSLINHTFLPTTGKWGAGSSTHVHFQAPAHEFQAKAHRVSGATAMLNYLVPGAKERSKGFYGYGANSDMRFGRDYPGIRTWTNPGEENIGKKYGITLNNNGKKRTWKPDSGNIAAEVRYNAPMHGDPHLSRKYLQLVELALSDHPAAREFQRLGEELHKRTGGDTQKLYHEGTRTHVVNEFERILNNSPEFKNDKTLQHFIGMARTKKQIPVQNVIKAWKKF